MSLKELKILEALRCFREDAYEFVRKAFGVEPTWQQEEVLRAISKPGSRVSVASGHGIGKTTVEAWTLLWFLSLHDNCRIPCTAPTQAQLKDVLWAEVSKWHRKMHPFFREQIRITETHIMNVSSPKTRFAVGKTARPEKPEALQGFHEGNLLFLIDEASGIDDSIFEVGEGSMSTSGARVLMCSNWTRDEGYFHESQLEGSGWLKFSYSCVDSPNVDESYVERMRNKYGEDSNIYRIRVLGKPPLSSDDVLIPFDWVNSSFGRDIIPTSLSKLLMGVDVARFGDDSTALVLRRGLVVLFLEQWRNRDLMVTCGKIVDIYKRNKVDKIYIDAIGVGGGVVDRLEELGLPVVGVNVSEAPSERKQFHRLRDELWWRCREFFESRQSRIDPKLKLGEDLRAELTTIRYDITDSTGRIKIESKDSMKKRGLSSPNLADGLCLTFADGINGPLRGAGKSRNVIIDSAEGWT